MVTACLRIVGLHREKRFLKYHRVLSCAVWSSLALSRMLLALLVTTFAATGTLVFGVDDTIERSWGLQIRARHLLRSCAFEPSSFRQMTMVVRFRMGAALYGPAPPRVPNAKSHPRKKGTS